jgi:hypothetical protein
MTKQRSIEGNALQGLDRLILIIWCTRINASLRPSDNRLSVSMLGETSCRQIYRETVYRFPDESVSTDAASMGDGSDRRDVASANGRSRRPQICGPRSTGGYDLEPWQKAQGAEATGKMDQGHYLRHNGPGRLGSGGEGWPSTIRRSGDRTGHEA